MCPNLSLGTLALQADISPRANKRTDEKLTWVHCAPVNEIYPKTKLRGDQNGKHTAEQPALGHGVYPKAQ